MADLVALQTMLPQIQSPFEQAGQAMKLSQMANANQQAIYQQQQQQQAQADDQAARAAYVANPTDGAARLSAMAGISPKAYATEQQAQLAQQKGAADVSHLGAQTQQANMAALNQAFTLHRDQINTVTDPASAAAWVASAYKDPTLGPLVSQSGPLDQAIARIPTDPTGFANWKLQAGLNADDYVKRTTVDANTAANNATSTANNTANNTRIASEGAANRGNAIKVQQMITDRQGSDDDGSGLSDATKNRIAQQAVDSGDYSGLKNIGRGQQGARDLRGIQNAITDYATSKGMSPGDISAKLAEFEGIRTGMRATGNISARIENAAEEAAQLVPLALDASRNVARSGLLPFGKAQIMFDTQTNDPDLARFATANTGLATAYASAMSRGNKPTVSDMEHARSLLSTAKDQPSYEATIAQMQQEIQAAQRAPQNVRANLSGQISGRGGSHGSAPVAGGVVNFGDLK